MDDVAGLGDVDLAPTDEHLRLVKRETENALIHRVAVARRG